MLARKKILLPKIETTYGVDSAPTGDDYIVTSNLDVQILQGDKVSASVDRPTLGNDEQFHVAPNSKVSFEVYVQGAGTAGNVPQIGVLLRACGFKETVTPGTDVKYVPVSANYESATLKYNMDGEEYALLGARGTVSVDFNAGGLGMFKFEFTGLSTKGTVTPAPALNPVTLPVPIAVEEAHTEFSVGAFQAKLHSLSANVSNSVVHRNLVNDESVLITDRAPGGSIKIDRPTQAQWDFEQDVRDNARKAVTLTHGKTAGNIVELSMPTVQVLTPSFGDADGIATLDLELNLLPDTGDDEIQITFK